MKQFTILWDSLQNISFPAESIEKWGFSVSITKHSTFTQVVTISIPENSSQDFTPGLIFKLGVQIGQLNALESRSY